MPNPLPTGVRVRHNILSTISLLLMLAGMIWLMLATAPLRERKSAEERHHIFLRNGVSATAAGLAMAFLSLYLRIRFYRTPAGRPFLCTKLVMQLSTIRDFVSRAGHNFAGLPWRNADELLAELDALIAPVTAGERPNRARLDELFRYGSDLRRLAEQNGWDPCYLELAPRVRFCLRQFRREA